MTVHRDYANKGLPGDYLYNRHGEIAAEVNRRLGVPAVEQKPEQKPQGDAKNLYRVQLGAFEKKDNNATAFAAKLKKEGFDTYIVQIGKYYKVQVGVRRSRRTRAAMLGRSGHTRGGSQTCVVCGTTDSGSLAVRAITIAAELSGDRDAARRDDLPVFARTPDAINARKPCGKRGRCAEASFSRPGFERFATKAVIRSHLGLAAFHRRAVRFISSRGRKPLRSNDAFPRRRGSNAAQ